jgi:NADH-ubiquinone oxidoreductase chain 5
LSVIEGAGLCICCFVILGALTKRAQYPFSSWLPLAMAAPTPVSALVHSSTLVTAGVYLLIRFFPVIAAHTQVISIMVLTRRLTIVLAGLAAFVEIDFKKIIAYSTLSQLGVIIFALGLGSPSLAFFHLLSHAIFKALMFICAGTFIFYHAHAQDLRIMGNMADCLPITQLGFIISNLALCGFPFLSGFYSKDPVYELRVNGASNFVATFFIVFGLLMTAIYSIRSILFSQLGPNNQGPLNCFRNNRAYFTIPVLFLGRLAVVWGARLN